MKKWVIIVLLLLPFCSGAQIITCFAGSCSHCTVVGDEGPATAAYIDDPNGCIFSKDGTYYVATLVGNRIRKIDSRGIITTYAGNGYSGYTDDGGPATSAKLNGPVGVAIDSLGNLYFSEAGNNTIRKVDISTGIITTICGNGSSGFFGDNGPASAALLYAPDGLCFDKFGNLYIADGQNNRIRKINTLGIITTFAGISTYGYNGDGEPATIAQLHLPTDVVADDTGNIYITDGSNARIRKVDTFGIISTFAGNGISIYIGDGIPATNAQFVPGFIKLDSFDNLYVTDPLNYRVYKIDNTGIFHCITGNGSATNTGNGGPATAASIYYPSGIAIDACNNLYISNVDYNEIRVIAFNASCTDSLDSIATLNITNISTYTTIAIYPNPATNELTITANTQIKEITISNMVGQTVASPRPSPRGEGVTTLQVDISGLPDGVYMVAVIDEEGNRLVRKILKQN